MASANSKICECRGCKLRHQKFNDVGYHKKVVEKSLMVHFQH